MQNPRPFFLLKVVFRQATGHLHTDIEHGLGHLDVLALQESLSLMGEIESSSTSVDLMSQYAAPLPSGVETSEVIAESIAAGLHINGVIGAVLALICVFLVRVGRK